MEIGASANRTFQLADGNGLAIFGRAAWAHQWESDPSAMVSFLSLPGSSFCVNGAPHPADLALVSVGAELRLKDGWSVVAKFNGEFGSGSQTYEGTARLRYVWSCRA